jgi:hypothetical protein
MISNSYIYLNSSVASYDEDTKFFRFNLVNAIVPPPNHVIAINCTEIEMPISYYLIDETNSKLVIDIEGNSYNETFTINITHQNYNINELISELNLSGSGGSTDIVFSFDKQKQKISIVATAKNLNTSVTKIKINSLTTINKLVGFELEHEVTGSSATLSLQGKHFINLHRTHNIFLKSDMILSNLDTYGKKSNIIAKSQVNASLSDILVYQSDSGRILLDKKITYMDHINLRLTNDDDLNVDLNGLYFNITLYISFQELKERKFISDDEPEFITNPFISFTGGESPPNPLFLGGREEEF